MSYPHERHMRGGSRCHCGDCAASLHDAMDDASDRIAALEARVARLQRVAVAAVETVYRNENQSGEVTAALAALEPGDLDLPTEGT